MNKLNLIASKVLDQPLLCTQNYLETVASVLEGRIGIDAEGLFMSEEAKDTKPYEVIGDTAVVPIIGGMVHRGSFMDAMSGLKSYGQIQKEIQAAINDPSVSKIMLEVDSGGGEVAGAFDLRDFIMKAKADKPIYALAKDTMGSAAYLISSAATEVYATQTAKVGSIGVVAMHTDASAANKEKGVKPTFIYAGKYKTAGNPHEPLGDEAKAYLQESVDKAYDMFVGAVCEARGLSSEAVRATEAKMFNASDAVDLGLVDGVMSYDDIISKLSNNDWSNNMSNDFQAALEIKEQEFESLKAQVIAQGFRITEEGLEVVEPEESMDCDGVRVFKSEVPEALWNKMKADQEALVAAEAEKAFVALEKAASEALPNFAGDVATELFGAFGDNEAVMQALKAADAVFAEAQEEVGKAAPKVLSASEELEQMVQSYKAEHKVTYQKAYAAVAGTKEGKALIQKGYKEGK